MKEYTVTTEDGFLVGVTEFGTVGIPLVFLHGFSVSTGAYTEMLELLSQSGFHVFGIDAPDHGGSDSLPRGHTVKDMARVIDQVLDELDMPECILVGHSMGGWLAAEVAALYPIGFTTVILLNAAVGDEFHESIRVGGLSPLARGAQFFGGALKDVIGDARKAGRIRTLLERLRLVDILRGSVSGPGMVRAAYAMMQSDSTEALRALAGTVRTVVVHGTEDSIVPWQAGLSAAVASAGRVVLLAGQYHSWMIADPELALSVIQDALEPFPEIGAV